MEDQKIKKTITLTSFHNAKAEFLKKHLGLSMSALVRILLSEKEQEIKSFFKK